MDILVVRNCRFVYLYAESGPVAQFQISFFRQIGFIYPFVPFCLCRQEVFKDFEVRRCGGEMDIDGCPPEVPSGCVARC